MKNHSYVPPQYWVYDSSGFCRAAQSTLQNALQYLQSGGYILTHPLPVKKEVRGMELTVMVKWPGNEKPGVLRRNSGVPSAPWRPVLVLDGKTLEVTELPAEAVLLVRWCNRHWAVVQAAIGFGYPVEFEFD